MVEAHPGGRPFLQAIRMRMGRENCQLWCNPRDRHAEDVSLKMFGLGGALSGPILWGLPAALGDPPQCFGQFLDLVTHRQLL